MEYITLKNSELKVSRLCMGGCPLGGYGWGHVEENDLLDAVRQAIDEGVNFFDTADTYGLGQSEITLGKALGNDRHQVYIASKFGVRVENGTTFYDNSPEWIQHACTESLRRLHTDYIDLYQIHYRDGHTPIGEVVETLKLLQNKGYIRYFGLSNIHEEDKKELEQYVGTFVSFQDEYSLACRKNERDILQLSKQLQLSPFTWGSLGQGILTGKYDEKCHFDSDDRRSREIYVNFHGDKLLKNLRIVKEMKMIEKELERTLGKEIPISAIAIRYILDYIPDSVVLAGIKNKTQLHANVEAFGWKLSQEQLERLEEISRE